MTRSIPGALALCALPLALSLSPLDHADAAQTAARVQRAERVFADASSPCVDFIRIQPVLTVVSSGSTLTGPVSSSLTIHSNGLVLQSRWDGLSGRSFATTDVVDPALVQDLADDLAALDADVLCDSPLRAMDVPMTTVSFTQGGADARTHSFSYTIADGPIADVAERIDQFLLENALE